MASLATTEDVEARWRPLTDSERPIAEALLQEAEALVAVAAPGVRERAAKSVDVATATRSVLVSMVLRVLKNPDAIRQFAVDDYSQTRDQVASSGLLYATPEELAYLRPASLGLAGMYVVSLGG